MRILLLHADHFEYKAREKAIPESEPLTDENKEQGADEVLVAMCTVEKEDELNLELAVRKTAEEISNVAKMIKVRNIFVYPYAHLSTDLARPKSAVNALKGVEESLRNMDFNVRRAPFGWYKSFTLKCKGHPLAELSRTIKVEAAEAEVEEKKELKKRSKYLVLTPDGEECPLSLSAVDECEVLSKHPSLKQFIIAEEIGRVPGEFPPHIKLMRRLELVDYEPASDVGHFRFYPKGALIKELLEDFAGEIARRVDAMRIETPLIYRLEKDIAEQASRFLEKDYRFKIEDKELVLRFAGDFGLFKMMSSAIISYKNLPLRVYELSSSFRCEKRGECVGLRRLRAFTMPDVHCFCRDLEQGMDEYRLLFENYTLLTDSMKLDYVVVFRVVEEFYLKNKEWFKELVRIVKKPALIELLPEMKHYWVVKHEFQFIDSVGGNAQLCTVQLDIEDSERYGIYYVDEDGRKKGCIIIHSSMGSIERWIYALLEQAVKEGKKGKKPMLPVWINPTQVRLIPVSKEYLKKVVEISSKLDENKIRTDIDDRDETLSSKIRDAEREWIPLIVVVGKLELEKNTLSVRMRWDGVKEMSLSELIQLVKERVKDMPWKPLPLPKFLSKRPQFMGR